MLVEIVPNDIQYAVELYVRPLDLPSSKGQKVRFLLMDSGRCIQRMAHASYGTFGEK